MRKPLQTAALGNEGTALTLRTGNTKRIGDSANG
jgi:hypothetical protein